MTEKKGGLRVVKSNHMNENDNHNALGIDYKL